jgi:hypothetical protein
LVNVNVVVAGSLVVMAEMGTPTALALKVYVQAMPLEQGSRLSSAG